MRTEIKQRLQQRRRWRIRSKVIGSAARPRMSVRFTGRHVYVQFIDDAKGVTLAAASSRPKGKAAGAKNAANSVTAKQIGEAAASAAKAAGIETVVFDRSGARFHGKVKAFAEAARSAGLKF